MRAIQHFRFWIVSVFIVILGCGDGTSTTKRQADTEADTSLAADDAQTPPMDTARGDTLIAHDAQTHDTEATDTRATPLPATDYCEHIAAFFCDYYLRCDRMAVPDVATCLSVFDEVCNAVYEPQWVQLADRGLLSLTHEGVARCKQHLATVSCVEQRQDLDGDCAFMWRGTTEQGGPCGPGLASFVCSPDTTCVLGLDFCGTCRAAASSGANCDDDIRCHSDHACVGGVCQARPRAGQPCSDTGPACVTGTTCDGGVCRSNVRIVEVGDVCDQANRCPYKSECVAKTCVASQLLGQPCDADQPCASGDCVERECVAASTPAPSACLSR